MSKILDIKKQTSTLTKSEKEGLVAYLVDEVTPLIGASDKEVLERESEMDSGEVQPLSHAEFLAQVGRS